MKWAWGVCPITVVSLGVRVEYLGRGFWVEKHTFLNLEKNDHTCDDFQLLIICKYFSSTQKTIFRSSIFHSNVPFIFIHPNIHFSSIPYPSKYMVSFIQIHNFHSCPILKKSKEQGRKLNISPWVSLFSSWGQLSPWSFLNKGNHGRMRYFLPWKKYISSLWCRLNQCIFLRTRRWANIPSGKQTRTRLRPSNAPRSSADLSSEPSSHLSVQMVALAQKTYHDTSATFPKINCLDDRQD